MLTFLLHASYVMSKSIFVIKTSIILPLTALNLKKFLILIYTHLKLCLATAIHNFKWLKIYTI